MENLEERRFRLRTQSEIICDEEHFYVYEKGSVDTGSCWILSDRDVWYRNPHYRGKVTPHPEDYYPED